jgi:hypothetical protein
MENHYKVHGKARQQDRLIYEIGVILKDLLNYGGTSFL